MNVLNVNFAIDSDPDKTNFYDNVSKNIESFGLFFGAKLLLIPK